MEEESGGSRSVGVVTLLRTGWVHLVARNNRRYPPKKSCHALALLRSSFPRRVSLPQCSRAELRGWFSLVSRGSRATLGTAGSYTNAVGFVLIATFVRSRFINASRRGPAPGFATFSFFRFSPPLFSRKPATFCQLGPTSTIPLPQAVYSFAADKGAVRATRES